MRYWETLFDRRFMWDSEWKQRRDIIEAEDAAMAADARSAATLDRIYDQQTQITMLQGQVHDLSVTVMALVELLADAKQIDPQELRARVEATFIGERAAAREASELAARDTLDHDGLTAATTTTALLVCTRCSNRVPANRTTMTADGVVCDNCAR